MKPKHPKNPLKASRRGSREAEIAMYGHPLPKHKIHRSKRQYSRKIAAARLKKGEFFISCITGRVFLNVDFLLSFFG